MLHATVCPCTQCFGSVTIKSEYVTCRRPVDCYTKVPLDYLPGYINETIYGDNIETGWAWYPFPAAPAANAVNNKQLQVPTSKQYVFHVCIHSCMLSTLLHP